ncbi:PAS domain S-box protein [Methylomonas sp. EFPC1]|uniref:PAS domain S-box protein n=1 Tax=Methylomonas sp. EFPC1 TaxID=2812647 RepID=UPI0019684ED2|nr:PAS domain S-box protein [Methylomonas sp. EFPC1]QSB02938.1 PAS domain S-box protein [Methylomonas sp. EFPC1]
MLESKAETLRIQKLHECCILDTPPESNFDDIVRLAALMCDTPFAVITLVDSDREWFKAKKGIAASEQPRDCGFGTPTLSHLDVLVVPHLEHDSRFAANPLVVSEPHIRFYAGSPILIPTGEALGVLCVFDVVQRALSVNQLEGLKLLARQVGAALARRQKEKSRSDILEKPTAQALPADLGRQDTAHNAEHFNGAILDSLSKQYCVLDGAANILKVSRPWLDFDQAYAGDKASLQPGQNYLALLDTGLTNDRGGKVFAEGIRSVLNGTLSRFSLEYPYCTGSGQLWFAGKVILFPDQNLARLIVIHDNISEHKQREERLRQAVESAPNAIVMVNEFGTIVMVNAQTEASFGYARTELIGQRVEMLIPERFRGGHIGFRRAYLADPVSRPMGAGRDLYGLRKDGTEFPVEIGLGLIESHEETLVLSSIVDITERKRLEQRFRQAVESAPNAIVMVNESGTIVMVNAQTEASFGYARTELIGQMVEMLIPERFRDGHVGFRRAYLADPVSRPMGAGRDLYGLRKDGTEFPVEIGLGLIDDDNGIIVLSSIVDITERQSAHDKLKQTLNEKEMLLKEVYHRVKNNLQVVSSLINLQAGNVTSPETADLLKQSADRIKAMALLHEKLYQSKDLARIDFNEYIRSLSDNLLFGYGAYSDKLKLNMKIDNVFLDVDTAIPCGLIINELLSNAIKYAFPGDRRGEIGIAFTQEQGEYILIISDNGIGLPSEMDFKKSSSLGLQLVDTLTNQLMGQMSLDRTNGSTFTLRFTKTC